MWIITWWLCGEIMEIARITFNIDKSTKTRIQQLALDKETTLTDLCVEWIEKGLENEIGQQKLEIE